MTDDKTLNIKEENNIDLKNFIEDDEDKIKGPCFKISDFDGPLDLLLELIKKSKMSIEEVKIAELTEQYLSFLSQQEDVDLDTTSEFISMAAYLLEIKSKSMLPKPVIIDDSEEDGEAKLKQQLAAYAIYKEASKKMKEIETVGIHYKPPDESVGKPTLVLKEFNVDNLTDALKKVFLKLSMRVDENTQRHIVKDRFTVEEKILHIKDAFTVSKRYTFSNLFEDGYTKSEIITTFLAILELIKSQFLCAIQEQIYSEIILEKVDTQD